uniref:Endo/exonuclease/phosphatase domain-containing protein n=1 Tax=Panagrellus redivivus TaxID=6233 RepID=A0A7E4V2Q1_PANRE
MALPSAQKRVVSLNITSLLSETNQIPKCQLLQLQTFQISLANHRMCTILLGRSVHRPGDTVDWLFGAFPKQSKSKFCALTAD